MRSWWTIALAVMAAALTSCGPAGDDLWHRGDIDTATGAADKRGTLVFVEFYTDWCSWCRRFESETLKNPDVRSELSNMVAVRLNAEGDGASAAQESGVDSYPTMLFLNPAGEEIERIVGYLPAEKFLAELRRIRTGDTLFACLRELDENPTDAEAVRRAVRGLLDRSDPEGAFTKIKFFHAAEGHDHELCRQLMFEAGRDLHYRSYLKAAKLYSEGWDRPLEVPPLPGSRRLSALLDEGLQGLDREEQADRMRVARFADTTELLELTSPEALTGKELFGAAELAFRGGHYERAAGLYERWFATTIESTPASELNRAAWQLYLARESLDTAVDMARKAHSMSPSPDVTDTLARLLYVSGDRAEALTFARAAAKKATGAQVEDYLDVVRRMERGLDLGDRPAFETYPGPRENGL